VGERKGLLGGADGDGCLARKREAVRPAQRGLLDGAVADVDERQLTRLCISRVDFDAVEAACMIEQREIVAQFANAEAQGSAVRSLPIGGSGKGEGVERRLAIAVGPPQARIGDVERRV